MEAERRDPFVESRSVAPQLWHVKHRFSRFTHHVSRLRHHGTIREAARASETIAAVRLVISSLTANR